MVDFNDIKKRAAGLRGKAETYLDEHKDQIGQGLDKAGNAIGKRTGKEQQVDRAVGKAKGFLDRQTQK